MCQIMSIYEYKLRKADGSETDLSSYRGHVLLIVNTASLCGFTPQLGELEALYQKYRDQGFFVLAFPCNQFREQDPEAIGTIEEFCRKNYGVTFPIFDKIEVNGENACPLFRHLTKEKGFEGFDFKHPLGKKLDEILSGDDPNYAKNDSIKWNFTKFLVDRSGRVVERFEPTAAMETIDHDLALLLTNGRGHSDF